MCCPRSASRSTTASALNRCTSQVDQCISRFCAHLGRVGVHVAHRQDAVACRSFEHHIGQLLAVLIAEDGQFNTSRTTHPRPPPAATDARSPSLVVPAPQCQPSPSSFWAPRSHRAGSGRALPTSALVAAVRLEEVASAASLRVRRRAFAVCGKRIRPKPHLALQPRQHQRTDPDAARWANSSARPPSI